MKLADSYGAKGIHITKKEDIEPAFREAMKSTKTPYILEFDIDPEDLVYPMVKPGGTLEDLIMALHRMREKCILTVYTESKYLYNGYEDAEYVKRWKQNDWTRSDGHEIKNRDKWQELDRLMQGNLVRILLNQRNAYTESLWQEIKMKER